VVMLALFPVFAGCSTTSPSDYAENAHPTGRGVLAEMFNATPESPTPAEAVPANCPLAPAGQRGPARQVAPPANSCSTATAVRVPSSPPAEQDPAASAYPSVALIDVLFGSSKPASR
jgi:hypothetical protein